MYNTSTSYFDKDHPQGLNLLNYDKLQMYIFRVEEYFAKQDEYVGYPEFPDFWMEIEDIWKDATDPVEQRMMFLYLNAKLLEVYRHWATDLDALWKDDKIANHEAIKETSKIVWKKNERNWSYFPTHY